MAARLWIREAPDRLREERLDPDPGNDGLVIGRDAAADIVLADSAVSRFHARLIPRDGTWVVIDLGSSNQTFVNGDPIRESELSAGDHIGIGDCELQFVDEIERPEEDDSRTQVVERLRSGPHPAEELRAAGVLDALHRLGKGISGRPVESTLPDEALEILVERLGADRGAILLLDGDQLLCRAARSRGEQALRGFVLSQSIYREVMQSREAILSEDTTRDARFAERRSIIGEEIRSVIAAPIPMQGRIGGILYLDRLQGRQAAFQTEDLYGGAVAGQFIGALLQAGFAVGGLVKEKETLVRTLIDTHPIIGQSAAIERVREFIRRAAPTESTVLIRGDTGTGKELVARGLHYQSRRRGAPFSALNCAAIPESLMESELFGHERGAFTGADHRKAGRFESADGGTVFLDEIGELPLSCQGKLLRLLEERCFERVGGNATVEVDVRIIAATNRDLALEVREGRFREDLYYRLNVLEVVVPPLDEREGDLELLIDHFLDHFSERIGSGRKHLSPAARRRLLEHRWPGNIRQLRNVIESAVVLAREAEIGPDDLTLPRSEGGPVAAGVEWTPCSLQELEREHIARMLDHVGWNKSKAAEQLGIERSTLYARLRNLEIHPPEERRSTREVP
jgi:transcriptional regulator with GAF, ATPase, and Fis domain